MIVNGWHLSGAAWDHPAHGLSIDHHVGGGAGQG